jgi:shikimate dehydrogenase
MMYGKDETPFLRRLQSRARGNCADGLGMLVEQAAEAFFVWRGVRPETGRCSPNCGPNWRHESFLAAG